MSTRIPRRVHPLFALMAFIAGCNAPAKIAVLEGARRDSLVFRLSPRDGPDTAALSGLVSFTVDRGGGGRTSGGIQWQIVATEAARGQPGPRTIRYGHVPPGYLETRPPAILGPGSYNAIALAPGTRGHLQFQVSVDGNVR